MIKKLVVAGLALAGLMIVGVVAYLDEPTQINYEPSISQLPQVDLTLNQHQLTAYMAADEPSRIRGLSGTKKLSLGQALVFDFGHEGDWRIWMKDMLIAIDVIWVDQTGEIVHLEDDLQPEDPPKTIYRSPRTARYVIELNDQAIEELSLEVGQQVVISTH